MLECFTTKRLKINMFTLMPQYIRLRRWSRSYPTRNHSELHHSVWLQEKPKPHRGITEEEYHAILYSNRTYKRAVDNLENYTKSWHRRKPNKKDFSCEEAWVEAESLWLRAKPVEPKEELFP